MRVRARAAGINSRAGESRGTIARNAKSGNLGGFVLLRGKALVLFVGCFFLNFVLSVGSSCVIFVFNVSGKGL